LAGLALANIPARGTAFIAPIPGQNGRLGFALTDSVPDSGGVTATYTLPTPLTGSYAVELGVSATSTTYIETLNKNGKLMSRTLFINEDYMQATETGLREFPLAGYKYQSKGLLYNLRLEYNSAAKKYDIYWTGADFDQLNPASLYASVTLSGKTAAFRGASFHADAVADVSAGSGDLAQIRISKSHGSGVTYVSNITAETFAKPRLNNVTVTDVAGNTYRGEEDVPANLAKVSLGFDLSAGAQMDESKLSAINLTGGGETVTPASAVYDAAAGVYEMHFDADLDADTAYALNLSAVADTRGLSLDGLTPVTLNVLPRELGSGAVAYTSGGAAIAKGDIPSKTAVSAGCAVTNNTAVQQTAALMLAIYKDGVLSGVSFSETAVLEAGESPFLETDAVAVPSGFTASDRVTVILWRIQDGLKPLRRID
jgi:hypothetical protein